MLGAAGESSVASVDAHGIIVYLVGGLLLLWMTYIARKVSQFSKDASMMKEVITGVPANKYAARAAIPGIGETVLEQKLRIDHAEAADEDMRRDIKILLDHQKSGVEDIAAIKEQLTTFNGGSTVKAGLRDMRTEVAGVKDQVAALAEAQVEEHAIQRSFRGWIVEFVFGSWQHNLDKAKAGDMTDLKDAPPLPPELRDRI